MHRAAKPRCRALAAIYWASLLWVSSVAPICVISATRALIAMTINDNDNDDDDNDM